MNYLIILLLVVISLIILACIYDVNLKKLKNLTIDEEKRLNNIVQKYPSNIDICKYILKKLNNMNVKVEEDKNTQTCLYIALTNKIIIADIKNSYTRIQTIAHECLHSIQDRKILLFNFIYSNLYILYFFTILILTLFGVIKEGMLYIVILLILSYIQYFVKSYLENDAMIKAKYIAKEYMQEIKISDEKEIDKIIESYDKINSQGIKIVNYKLMLETMYKVIIVTFISFI